MASNDDQLNWTATRYVLGELPEQEVEEFEERLLVDLTACEAVAQASQITSSLRAALAAPTAGLESVVVRRRSGWAVAAALALVACVCLVMGSLVPQTVDRRTEAELMTRWRSEANLLDVDAEDLDDESDDDTELAVPDWLLAGVTLEREHIKDVLHQEQRNN